MRAEVNILLSRHKVVAPLRQQLSKPAQEPAQYGESEVEE